MLVIPLPGWLLSILILLNISLSIVSYFDFDEYARTITIFHFSFTYYLLLTLFRLGLNVSTTRSILAKGDAGGVVDTFGSFVVGR